jgi:hypothetical protein
MRFALVVLVACKAAPVASNIAGDAGAVVDGAVAIDAPAEDTTGPIAVAASTFLDSIGVCTHIAQGIDDPAMSGSALAYAGIRGIRDDGDPDAVASWITAHTASGVRLSLLTDQNVASTISMAEQLNAAGALLAVEGANEPNNFPVTYNGATSSSTTFAPVAHLQADLYAAVKTDPALTGVPVFHSSEAGGSEPDNVGLQFLTIPPNAGTTMPDGTKYADYANTHNYIVGHGGALVDNVAWQAEDPTLNASWDGLYVEYGVTWGKNFAGYSNAQLPTVPRVTTETGWTTSGDPTSLTEEQQARVFLDLYLTAFARGWAYTFIYMMRDDASQGYWGLFNIDYTPKTSGTYVHNLTTILADTAVTSSPGHLNYSISNEPATVHDLLLQKSDRTFELAVWDEHFSSATGDSVAVSLGRSYATVNVYDPTTGTAPVQTLTNVDTVTLMLTDHPVIIEPN